MCMASLVINTKRCRRMTDYRAWLVAGCFFVLSGCSFWGSKDGPPPCYFPDGSEVSAPAWLCEDVEAQFALQVIGVADYSHTGQDFMRQAAHTAAQNLMLQAVRVEIQQVFHTLVALHPELNGEYQEAVTQSFLRWMPVEPLQNLPIAQEISMPSGGLAVRVGLTEALFRQMKTQAMREALIVDYELWQAFLAAESLSKIMHDLNRL